MTALEFSVVDVAPDLYAAVPTLLFRLRADETSGTTVHAIALRCQVRIEPQRRRYAESEADGLLELFGEPARFGQTLKPFLWTQTSTVVRGFTGSIEFDLPVPCTYDFEVVAAKYLHALSEGEIPLVLLFNGTVFTHGSTGFAAEPVPWHLETSARLPVTAWRTLMDRYFPSSGWIRVNRATLDALIAFKAARALPSWEQTFDVLLAPVTEPAS